ncbi:hypothetical protein [Kitasatospora sp. NPDC058218]|uniref:hypothetical protein n=1 Tax=Kitasatospora sp. NPDC058218 TaxID=3346385 RepID=UPI0036D7AA86
MQQRADRDLTTLGEIIEPAAAAAPAPVRARARLVVAAHSRDREDCRALLQALGLEREDDTEDAGTAGAAARICVHCGRSYQHPGVRRRDRFCSTRCYRLSGEQPGAAATAAAPEAPGDAAAGPLPAVAPGPRGSGQP